MSCAYGVFRCVCQCVCVSVCVGVCATEEGVLKAMATAPTTPGDQYLGSSVC